MSNVMLYVRATIVRNNNGDPRADSTSAPVNLLLHSMFSQVDVSLNGTLISSSTNTYPYRSMLETLLSFGEDAKKSQLSAELFYKDDAGNMEETIVAAAGNRTPNYGLQKRRALITQSKEFDMMGRIHSDICQQKYLLSQVDIKIKLIRSNDNFCLIGAADAKIVVTHASLFVRKVKLSSTTIASLCAQTSLDLPSSRWNTT